MSFQNEKLTILYGSQTGNAQDVAERIWRESKRYYFVSTIQSMDEYNIGNLLVEKIVIFVCSTTGQGEEPDNMRSFWKFLLRKNLPTDSLVHLRYAVLGLGDSSYAKFNFVAKRLFKRLQQLGGEALQTIGLADEQHDLGYDGTTDPWTEELFQNLVKFNPLPPNLAPLSRNLPILPRWSVLKLPSTTNVNRRQSIYYSTRSSKDFTATLIGNERLTSEDHFQDVRLLKFRTNGEHYNPGDLIVLRPRNLPWQVDEFFEVLETNNVHIPAETVVELSETDSNIPVPAVLKYSVTIRQLLEEYFDLMAIPRRHTFNILAQLTDSELEKEKCVEFTTAEGQDDLYSYTNRPRRNIVEVLRDFPHATKNLTAEMLFELMTPIKAREFSIASSFLAHKNEVHILLAIVKYKTKLIKERFGLCSNYLGDMGIGDEITACLKRGSFKFPDNGPVIMVGPGTGVAPFRNYICEQNEKNLASSKDLLLFFGCRNEEKDFFCSDDFVRLKNEDKLNLICAFSRDQEGKVYVQDKIVEHCTTVWKMLNAGANIYVAGNAKLMPQAVRDAFLQVCVRCGGMDEDNAVKYVEKLEKNNKYQTECWS